MRQLTRLKKMLAGILAAAMVFTTGVGVVSAAEGDGTTAETGSLTIENAVSGNTYKVYRVFDFAGSTEKDGNYTEGVYKLNEKWEGFATYKNDEIGNKFKIVPNASDASSYFTVIDGGILDTKGITDSRVKAFSQLAFAYAREKGIDADYTGKNDSNSTNKIVFDNIPLGYYLVDSYVGTLVSLGTTSRNAIMREKNEVPTIEKKVFDEDKKEYNTSNDAEVGEVVTFQVTIHAKAGAQKYILHEQMSEGLTFNEITKIILKDGETEEDMTPTFLKNKNNPEIYSAPATDDHTFDLSVCQDCLDQIEHDMDIIITYTATVNEKAVIARDANTNDVYLEYGEGSKTETAHTNTYVYKFNLHKYSASDSTSANLAGAKFKLLSGNNVKEDRTEINLVKVDDKHYSVATEDDIDKGNVAESIVTVADGDIVISGLDAGTYYLRETEAPSGYNLPADDIKVFIERKNKDAPNGSYTIYVDEVAMSDDVVPVKNQTGFVLPSTGGMGTTIFYIVGGILIIAGLAWFIVRRKTQE